MKKKTCWALAIGAIGALVAFGAAAADAPAPRLSPRNDPLRWALGDWICHGKYETIPPFTVEHTVTAWFRVAPAVAGEWLTGVYEEFESSNSALLSLDDSFSIDPVLPSAGLRTFIDSTTGQFRGLFFLVGSQIHFAGTYVLAHQTVPFVETLTRFDDDRTFTTEASVVPDGAPLVFHRQKCTKTR